MSLLLRGGRVFDGQGFVPLDLAIDGERIAAVGTRLAAYDATWELDGDLFAVVHLMIAGRLRWREKGAAIPGKVGLLALDFPDGTLIVT